MSGIKKCVICGEPAIFFDIFCKKCKKGEGK